MSQTITTQLGSEAIAHHPPQNYTLPPVPALYHLDDGITKIGMQDSGDDLEFHDLPPFPDDVPTAPLLRLSLKKLLNHDSNEEERLWQTCRDVGFFYLDLRDSDQPSSANGTQRPSQSNNSNDKSGPNPNGAALLNHANQLFPMGEKVFRLSTAEKQTYDFKDQGSYFGYKGLGAGVVDAKGTKDANEFYNVSKDDLFGISEVLPAPEVLRVEESREVLRGFMTEAHGVVRLLLGVLNRKLGLVEGKLEDLHRLMGVSGDQVRWVRSPPKPDQDASQLALGEHTDFGSVTVLFNRLGGLQILPPGGEEWCYVKPLQGHCIVNLGQYFTTYIALVGRLSWRLLTMKLGDAMVKFTSGVLRSNIHRVVNPPGRQADQTRMSLVYFARPEDEVLLKPLEGSDVIDAKQKEDGGAGDDEEVITSKEWIKRRALGRRTGGNYAASHGTEGGRMKA
ncbi:hypothetical protein LTR86_004713 [Recurvomyces mirabilis]|nr:hypothetical protein LTR86_004713 [Recurvomyces mirabilis]